MIKKLNDNQKKVLALLSQNYSLKAIAKELNLPLSTIKSGIEYLTKACPRGFNISLPKGIIPQIIEKEGMMSLYIIHCEGSDYYKIGKTGYSNGRLGGLQVGCPFKLTLIAESPYYNKELIRIKEKELHQYLRPYHIRGEWYQLIPEILEILCQEIFSTV